MMQSLLAAAILLFSCSALRRDTLRYYNDEKQVVMDDLQKAPGRICFTTDNWRSEHRDDEYMCITAHWIDANWKLQKRIIKFGALAPPFDGDSLADEIALCLGQWKNDHKVLGFTVDNASYNDAMIKSLKTDLSRKSFLYFDEWDKVSLLHEFLKVFYDVTSIFSASKTPTSNIFFHGVWRIHRKLIEVSDGPSSQLSLMTTDMREKFEKYWSYWSDYNLLLSCAAVLDPRFKLERVEYCYEKLYGKTYAKEMVSSVKNTLSDLFDEYKGVTCPFALGVGSSSCSGGSTSDIGSVKGVVDQDELEFKAFLTKKRKADNKKSELELYLEETYEDLDVLQYWRNNSTRFPNLVRIARDILAIPISTVPSESAFSMAKKMINPWRASLGETTIESLACYEDWLRAKGLRIGSSMFFGNDALGDGDDEDGNEEDGSTLM